MSAPAVPACLDPAAAFGGEALPRDVATPCFVVSEPAVMHNLAATLSACGGAARLMPHVKTHRAPWVVERLVAQGVAAFKTATVAEARMALAAGACRVLWAYPTVGPTHLQAYVALAREFPAAELGALVDSDAGLDAWREALAPGLPANLGLRIDLDPGMGRTGVPAGPQALALARRVHALGCLAGWHVYDGHIQDRDIAVRRERVLAVAGQVKPMLEEARAAGLPVSLVAGGSYSFDLWPADLASHVSPGSWTYSSAQHDVELAHLGWRPAAWVLATVISRRDGKATLDAGAKAISPDKPLADRFRWDGGVLMMSEEHAVVRAGGLSVGDRVLLLPRHACTTAYLYDRALVRTMAGTWEYRPQLGNAR